MGCLWVAHAVPTTHGLPMSCPWVAHGLPMACPLAFHELSGVVHR